MVAFEQLGGIQAPMLHQLLHLTPRFQRGLLSRLLAYSDAGPAKPQESMGTHYDRYIIATY